MHLVYTKSVGYDTRDVAMEARVPFMFFQPQGEDFQNTRIYVPSEYFTTSKKILTVSGLCLIIDSMDSVINPILFSFPRIEHKNRYHRLWRKRSRVRRRTL